MSIYLLFEFTKAMQKSNWYTNNKELITNYIIDENEAQLLQRTVQGGASLQQIIHQPKYQPKYQQQPLPKKLAWPDISQPPQLQPKKLIQSISLSEQEKKLSNTIEQLFAHFDKFNALEKLDPLLNDFINENKSMVSEILSIFNPKIQIQQGGGFDIENRPWLRAIIIGVFLLFVLFGSWAQNTIKTCQHQKETYYENTVILTNEETFKYLTEEVKDEDLFIENANKWLGDKNLDGKHDENLKLLATNSQTLFNTVGNMMQSLAITMTGDNQYIDKDTILEDIHAIVNPDDDDDEKIDLTLFQSINNVFADAIPEHNYWSSSGSTFSTQFKADQLMPIISDVVRIAHQNDFDRNQAIAALTYLNAQLKGMLDERSKALKGLSTPSNQCTILLSDLKDWDDASIQLKTRYNNIIIAISKKWQRQINLITYVRQGSNEPSFTNVMHLFGNMLNLDNIIIGSFDILTMLALWYTGKNIRKEQQEKQRLKAVLSGPPREVHVLKK